jgi:hypothetical protein
MLGGKPVFILVAPERQQLSRGGLFVLTSVEHDITSSVCGMAYIGVTPVGRRLVQNYGELTSFRGRHRRSQADKVFPR